MKSGNLVRWLSDYLHLLNNGSRVHIQIHTQYAMFGY